jgi:lipopolysaccharide biosynthesis regulator YciM
MIRFDEVLAFSHWLPILILVLLLVGGYYLRRLYRKRRRQLRFSNEYFQGLNYLLNDEQDKALEIFLKLVEVDWETIDTSLALGSLFRRKGEIDKAIKLHQNLLARPSLPPVYKTRVLLELGRDYLQAGWLDRAENLFNEVTRDAVFASDALWHLITIYQQEHEWHEAIKSAWRYQKLSKEDMRPVIAQYYCELSEHMLAEDNLKDAEKLASQALSTDGNCVRASILLGRIAMARERFQKAILFFQQVEYQNSQFLPIVLDYLAACYKNVSSLKTLVAYLQNSEHKDDTDISVFVARLIAETEGRAAAQKYLVSRMQAQPTLAGVIRLLELDCESNHCDEALPKIAAKLLEKHHSYQCCKCGYAANTLYWLCPSCHSWSGMQPKP